MPTSETRTHASMTIPLSSTRSRTSMRLVPPAARSTGIEHSLFQRGRAAPHHRGQLTLERPHLLFELFILGRERLFARREMVIELPPVETDLLGLIDRADEEADADGQKLDFRERHLDIASDHEPLVENTIEDVDQTRGSSVPLMQRRRHKLRILWRFLWRSLAEMLRRDRFISAMEVPLSNPLIWYGARDSPAVKPDSRSRPNVVNSYNN